jgi:hypothetical protein
MNKNLQLTIAWFILASLLTATALWQAQVAVAREISASQKTLPHPLKTRHADRAAISSAPIADYATRLQKGLTDREIGWILDDFQTAGLERGLRVATQEEYLAQRRAQDRWYHDALVEAWSLTPEQSTQVTEKLAELYDQAKADFIETLAAGPQPVKVNDQWLIVTSSEPIHRLIDANRRFQDAKGRFLPWNLCKMAPELDPVHAGKKIDIQATDVPEDALFAKPIQIAPAAPNLFTVDQLLPKAAVQPEEIPIQVAPAENEILPPLRKLHPAQLKLLLLISPDKVKEIRQALDAAR